MILYGDSLVKLDYATAQDILFMEPQKREELCSSELKKILISIVGCVRGHEIGKLLLDFNKSTLNVTGTEYRSVFAQLVVGLMNSSVQKVAQIATKDPAIEDMVESVRSQVLATVKLPLEFRGFTSRIEALRWLMAQELA